MHSIGAIEPSSASTTSAIVICAAGARACSRRASRAASRPGRPCAAARRGARGRRAAARRRSAISASGTGFGAVGRCSPPAGPARPSRARRTRPWLRTSSSNTYLRARVSAVVSARQLRAMSCGERFGRSCSSPKQHPLAACRVDQQDRRVARRTAARAGARGGVTLVGAPDARAAPRGVPRQVVRRGRSARSRARKRLTRARACRPRVGARRSARGPAAAQFVERAADLLGDQRAGAPQPGRGTRPPPPPAIRAERDRAPVLVGEREVAAPATPAGRPRRRSRRAGGAGEPGSRPRRRATSPQVRCSDAGRDDREHERGRSHEQRSSSTRQDQRRRARQQRRRRRRSGERARASEAGRPPTALYFLKSMNPDRGSGVSR